MPAQKLSGEKKPGFSKKPGFLDPSTSERLLIIFMPRVTIAFGDLLILLGLRPASFIDEPAFLGRLCPVLLFPAQRT